MRLHFALPAIAASLLTTLPDALDAQVPSPQRTSVQTRIEGGLGFGTRVPGWGDEGFGPFLSGTFRFTPGPSGHAFLLGAEYGIVFANWTDPDGVRYNYAPETVILHLGLEWPLGAQRRFAIDGQWNPAISRIRRFGRQPSWSTGSSPWEATASTVSLGGRYTLTGSRGPVVAVNLRTYLALFNPLAVVAGAGPWHVVGLTVRRR